MIRKHAQPLWIGTNAERLSFTPPADSPCKTFYETDTQNYFWWDGTAWVEFGAGSGSDLIGYTGDENTALGVDAGVDVDTGTGNTAVGRSAGRDNTGIDNTALGNHALTGLAVGDGNTALGKSAMEYAEGVNYNTALGFDALSAAGALGGAADNNIAIGADAARNLRQGNNNIVIGVDAARYEADDSTILDFDDGVFIGHNVKVSAEDAQNEIVIGADAVGQGSNTVNLGNDSIVDTYLHGTVHASDIQFDLAYAGGNAEGQLNWNPTDGTLEFGVPGSGGVVLQIGQEQFARCRNDTGGTLLDGKVVRITGASGQRPTIAYGIANDAELARRTLGLLTQDIANGNNGYVTTFGYVRGLNTAHLTEGATVYLSATTAGEMTSTKPDAPNSSVRIGMCVYAHATEGIIYVNVLPALRLNYLQDVLTTSPVEGSMLRYNATLGIWIDEAGTLNSLSDVDVSTVSDGQYLRYNGSEWANDTITTTDLNDINASGRQPGDILMYDGDYWLTTPFAHATTHQDEGADEIAVLAPVAGGIPKAGADGLIDPSWFAIYGSNFVQLQAPLTSTSWDGDARSTTAKTLIDLSAVFGTPANIKAVLIRAEIRDSGSASADTYIFLAPTDAASVGIMESCAGLANDYRARGTHVVPCNGDGDIYYQIAASGAGTMDVKLEIWGYWLGDNSDAPDSNFIPLETPLTSTLFDGDAFSTTAKTKIDLSTVFGVPAGVKAVLVYVAIRDSAAATTDNFVVLSPNSTANLGQSSTCPPYNDRYGRYTHVVPCDENGDIYYQLQASGAGTLDMWLQIWGYWMDTATGAPTENLVMLQSPLTSTSFDGDAFSTTAKTLIDLSATFGAPAGIRAVLIRAAIRDSGSAAGDPVLFLSPNNTANIGPAVRAAGIANDAYTIHTILVPCDDNGDIYYQIQATGAGTMDVSLQIWGYVIPYSLELPSVITDPGDMIYGGPGGEPTKLVGAGVDGKALISGVSNPYWEYREAPTGWVTVDGACSYVSANSILGPGTLQYTLQKGDKFAIVQGGTTKYFYVTSIAPYVPSGTVVGLQAGSDYTVANAAISAAYFSHAENPFGFPDWFNWTPTLTGWSTVPPSARYRFKVHGRTVTVSVRQAGASVSNTTGISITAPITSANITEGYWGVTTWGMVDNGVNMTAAGRCWIGPNSATIGCYANIYNGAWTASGVKHVNFELSYEF